MRATRSRSSRSPRIGSASTWRRRARRSVRCPWPPVAGCERGNGTEPPRLAEETLHRFLIWCGVDLGLPIQFHVGYGDRDVDLHRCDPLLLTGLLRAIEPTGTPVMLLHNYPFHRQAGYLAQVFGNVFVDAGLATHNLGDRAAALIAEMLELTPFGKFLFSSDAFGLSELYHLGALQFRRGLSDFLRGGLERDSWSEADAIRVAASRRRRERPPRLSPGGTLSERRSASRAGLRSRAAARNERWCGDEGSARLPARRSGGNTVRESHELHEKFREAVADELPGAVALRRRLHADPRLSGAEEDTAAAVVAALDAGPARGRGRVRVAETGRAVRIGGDGPPVALRAETRRAAHHRADRGPMGVANRGHARLRS